MDAAETANLPPDVDLRAQYAGGLIAMTVIAVLVAWLRMYVRAYMIKNLGWDDWAMFIATVRWSRERC